MASVREDQVQAGVRFLQHDQVQGTPLSQRLSFLEQKGLSPAEIQEALQRSQQGGLGTQDGENSAALDQQDPLWKRLLVPGALFLAGLGVVGATRAKDVNEGAIERYRERLVEESTREAEASANGRAPESASGSSGERQPEQETLYRDLERAVEKLLAKLEGENSLESSMSKLSADLVELKGAIMQSMDNSEEKNVEKLKEEEEEEDGGKPETAGKGEIPVTLDDEVNNELDAALNEEELDLNLSSCLNKLRESNDISTIRAAVPTLKMYVRNLIENPGVPRYRRVNTLNQNFVKLVAPLEGHLEFLRSIGFGGAGSQLEWSWAGGSSDEGLQFYENLLQKSLEGLEGLLSVGSTAPKSSTETISEESQQEEIVS